jgi:dolichyl-phosphate beta-glucosyltransferase
MAPTQPLLTIIIPAYQEEKRLGPTLDELSKYFENRPPHETEIIVVSGGSTDGTVGVSRRFQNKIAACLRVLDLPLARGKGAAVRAGMLEATGKFVLFTDADLAYQPNLFDDFVRRLQAGADVVIAQRADATRYSGLWRHFVAVASRFVFERFITPGIGDTQAGLKAFTHAAAKDLFSKQKIDGFLFDLEILMLARRCQYRIEKVFVNWQDKPGSTVHLARESARGVVDLMKIYWRLGSGQYR